MKKAFKPALFVLLMYGVFGVDEVKSVSVMEGDSVTLNPNQTQIKTFNLIEWKFKDQLIASFDRSKTKYPNERFGDRLKLNQTGSLTITNMKTKHSGLYKLQIELNSGPVRVDFTVTVYESPSVIDAGKAEMKSLLVMSGDPVTLQTGVTPLSGDELIVWRFGEEGKLIAKADIEAKSSPLYDTDGRFRGRLKLELDQTGSLIITNTNTTDSGLYTVKISSSTQTVYKRFSVSVSEPGLSSGAVAGIVVAVLLVLAAVFVFYHRRKISELQKQILTVTVTVKEGEDVILKPNKEIQKGDVIQWMFGEEEQQTSIAEFTRETGEFVTHDDAVDWRFSGRLDLDETTGSLIIRNSRTTHSGLYTLHITSSSGDSQKRFIITVSERVEVISVEGGTVTLKPDTEIQRDDEILWMFGEEYVLIAQIRGGTGEMGIYYDDVLDGRFKGGTGEICIYDAAADGRFRGRLKLEKTGSLTITYITAADTGLYTLQISSSRGTLRKRFWVYIPLRRVYVTAGESVHLSTDRPKIERDDEIEWKFGGEIEGTGKTHDRDRLQVDDPLIQFSAGRGVSVTEGEFVHLFTDRPKIERDAAVTDKATGKPQMKGNNDESAVEMQSLLDGLSF